jgi:flavin-dependent dehydrogenase
VAVLGGGPAGSFFSYFLLDAAQRVGLDIQLDIYEPRKFSRVGPAGYNMCGGIISKSLVQALATEGVNLPPAVVQRGIDSYVMHMDVGSVHIETPLHEKRIAAVHRGSGPKDTREIKWKSFDGYLQSLALTKGANVIPQRVTGVSVQEALPLIKTSDGESQAYDLLAVVAGVNSAALGCFEDAGLNYKPPRTTKTFIREYYLGQKTSCTPMLSTHRCGIRNNIVTIALK